MSQPPSAGLPTTTSPATTGTHYPFSYVSGASASSSRPSTASAARTDPHGGQSGPPSARLLIESSTAAVAGRRYSAESTAQTPSRAFGVQSILNPQADYEDRDSGHIRLPPPLPMTASTRETLPAPAESPRSRKRTDPRSPVRDHDYPSSARAGRRVLTPKSPAIRAASLGARRNPSFHSTIQPLQNISGPGGRTYTAEPGLYRSSEIPPLPPLSIATGTHPAHYGSLDSRQSRSAHPIETPRTETIVTPQTEHSVSSQTSYRRLDQSPPLYRYGHGGSATHSSGPLRVLPAAGSGYGQETHVHGPHEGYQMGQSSLNMRLSTDQGPMVLPVEVDTQQASKVADEKRKRNAGASARFRARRKEKEKEASTTISGLQGELRDLIEERDFYLNERNYFRDLASNYIPPSQFPARPQSPQHTQLNTGAPSSTSDNPPLSDEIYHERSESGSAAQRRRTGDYHPTFATQQRQSPPASGYRSGFPSAPPNPLPPPSSTAYGTPRTLPPGPPLGPAITRSQSYDPLGRELYDKNWSSGR
ncbi:hypothetical protein LTR84_000156 [Exophiala bonariae]|uniref:BZIP domain-containing protein n=1 Tax=Exophiala bonariae TaxID=1690606 RepID=A0AAV9NTT2_9EURO|nr:hypothetical protein LTR84_000156 [Exophiala bonariae]